MTADRDGYIDLRSDTVTRPSAAYAAGDGRALRWATTGTATTRRSTALAGRRGRADRQGGRAVPADRHGVQPDRAARLRPAGPVRGVRGHRPRRRHRGWRRRPALSGIAFHRVRGAERGAAGRRSGRGGAGSRIRTTLTWWTWWRWRTPTRWAAVRSCRWQSLAAIAAACAAGGYAAVPGRRAHLQRVRGHRRPPWPSMPGRWTR